MYRFCGFFTDFFKKGIAFWLKICYYSTAMLKEVQAEWPNVHVVARVSLSASRFPTPIDAPIVPGSPMSSVLRRLSMARLAMCMFVPGVCVPVRSPERSNCTDKQVKHSDFGLSAFSIWYAAGQFSLAPLPCFRLLFHSL